MKHHLGISKAALLILALTAAGCAAQGGTPTVPSGASLSSLTHQGAAPLSHVVPLKSKLQGKYEGTIEWTDGAKSLSGTLKTTLRFNNKNIRGPFMVTFGSETTKCRIYGRVKSKTADVANIIFAIYNLNGGYVVGSGTIKNGELAGNAKNVAAGAAPVTVTFNATKS